MDKRILFVIGSMRAGGAERVLATIANELVSRGAFKVSILQLQDGDSAYELSSQVDIKCLGLHRKSSFLGRRFEILEGIRKMVIDFSPNIIVPFITETTLMTYFATIFMKIPIVASEHAVFRSKGFLFDILRRFVFKRIRHVICINKHDLGRIKSITENTSIIYNPSPFEITPNTLGIRENYAICVSSLDRHRDKGILGLIKIWPQIIQRHPKFRLYILGTGSDNNISIVEQAIYDHGLEDNVFLKGFQPQMIPWYQRARMLISASKIECLPMNLIEAQSLGCPVIAFDCPYGPREIITHRKTGFLVSNQDYLALKDGILELLENEDMLRDISSNGLISVEKFSKKKVIDQWVSLFDTVSE